MVPRQTGQGRAKSFPAHAMQKHAWPHGTKQHSTAFKHVRQAGCPVAASPAAESTCTSSLEPATRLSIVLFLLLILTLRHVCSSRPASRPRVACITALVEVPFRAASTHTLEIFDSTTRTDIASHVHCCPCNACNNAPVARN